VFLEDINATKPLIEDKDFILKKRKFNSLDALNELIGQYENESNNQLFFRKSGILHREYQCQCHIGC
jgi:hypothetical protein